MAANYWLSSQCNNWLLDRTQLEVARREDLKYATEHELGAIRLWLSNLISNVCKRLNLRQRVVATACVFLRRFFAKNSYSALDPFLVLAACIYVAAKVEESPIHIKSVVSEATRVFQETGYRYFASDNSTLAEMEFYLVEELEFDLIVFHSYRSLIALYESIGAPAIKERLRSKSSAQATNQSTSTKGGGVGSGAASIGLGLGLPAGSEDFSQRGSSTDAEINARMFGQNPTIERGKSDVAPGLPEFDEHVLHLSWSILNDTFKTDLPLMYPPHLISLGAIWVGLLLDPPARDRITKSADDMIQRRSQWSQQVHDILTAHSVDSENSSTATTTTTTAATATTKQTGSDTTPDNTISNINATATANQNNDNGTNSATLRADGFVAAQLPPPSASPGLPLPPTPPLDDALTYMASLNVSIPTVIEIVQELISFYDLYAQLKNVVSDGPGMVKLLERMREARRQHLVQEKTPTSC